MEFSPTDNKRAGPSRSKQDGKIRKFRGGNWKNKEKSENFVTFCENSGKLGKIQVNLTKKQKKR